MDEEGFWKVVEAARLGAGGNVDARPQALEAALQKLSLSEIQSFQQIYDGKIHQANKWALVGAAYLMNGGCSDDGFRYFCHWLISEGREVFEEALRNPDSLAERPKRDYFELESYAYVALHVFEAKGGGELERDFSIELAPLEGEEWSTEELPSMFPRLSAAYG